LAAGARRLRSGRGCRRAPSTGTSRARRSCSRRCSRSGSTVRPGRSWKSPGRRQRRATAPVVSHGLASLFRQQRELVLLLHEYWSAAVRDEQLRARYLERQRALRDALACALAARHAHTGVPLAMRADALATAFIALAEGLSLEALLDPDSVEKGLLGEIFRSCTTGWSRGRRRPAEWCWGEYFLGGSRRSACSFSLPRLAAQVMVVVGRGSARARGRTGQQLHRRVRSEATLRPRLRRDRVSGSDSAWNRAKQILNGQAEQIASALMKEIPN